METELVKIIIQGGALGVLILLLILQHKERLKMAEYFSKKNGHLERQATAFAVALENLGERMGKEVEDSRIKNDERNLANVESSNKKHLELMTQLNKINDGK